MNVLSATGNIGRDAEVRFLNDGTAITSFSFALTSGYGDKAITTWLNCSIFGKRGESVAKFLLKGTPVGITGELTNRPYQKDGENKYSLEVRVNDVTLLGKKDASTGIAYQSSARPSEQESGFDDFDDVPFG